MMLGPPNLGGRWTLPPEGVDGVEGSPPDIVINGLEKHSKDGIVISGVVTWINMHRGTGATGIWKEAALQCWNDEEVTESKRQLVSAMGPDLEEELKKTDRDFKTERKRSEKNPKKTLEINDIITILTFLSEKSKMPLVLASSDQLQRCPKTLGQSAPTYQWGRCSPRCSPWRLCWRTTWRRAENRWLPSQRLLLNRRRFQPFPMEEEGKKMLLRKK